ncbi:MAG: hypothetical protein MH204_02920 [Fimbriimonadaceae bacterium]|nr:hypothetical protein [Fimbriimonadaceae bacterium]
MSQAPFLGFDLLAEAQANRHVTTNEALLALDSASARALGTATISGSGSVAPGVRTVLVTGSGARSISLGGTVGQDVGRRVSVVDASGNSGAGAITISGTGLFSEALAQDGRSVECLWDGGVWRVVKPAMAVSEVAGLSAALAGLQPLSANLTGLSGLAGGGLVVRTSGGAIVSRSIAVGGNGLTMTNGDGGAGNPTVNLPTSAAVQLGGVSVGTPSTDGLVTVRRGTAGRAISVRDTADAATTFFVTDAGELRATTAIVGTTAAVSTPGIFAIVRNAAFNSEGNSGLRLLSASTGASVVLQMGADGSQNVGYIQAMHPGTSWGTRPLTLQANGGSVSIGTVSSSARLHVRALGTTGDEIIRLEDLSGSIRFRVLANGSFGFSVAPTAVQTGYSAFSNPATLRTLDTGAATLQQVAQCLGTVIEDLKAKGILAA